MSNTNLSNRKSDESPDDDAPQITPDHLQTLYEDRDLTLREIAAKLDVSPATVRKHLRETDWYRPRLDVILDELDSEGDDLRSDGGTAAHTSAAGNRPSRTDLWDAVRALAETVQHQRERIDRLEATVETQDEQFRDQQERICDQQDRIDDQRATIDDQRDRIQSLEETVRTQRETTEALEDWTDRTEETIRSVVADLNAREEGSTDRVPDDSTSGGPDPASSPLDFFLNCQQYHVDRHLSANRARAVEIVRRHEEFGRRKRSMSTYAGTTEGDGSVVFTKEDVAEGLTAIQGRKPHRQTVQRVWDYLHEMAGDDAEAHQFRDRRNDTRHEGLRFDADAIDRFEDGRYVGLDPLDDAGGVDPDAPGRFTPVVIGDRG